MVTPGRLRWSGILMRWLTGRAVSGELNLLETPLRTFTQRPSRLIGYGCACLMPLYARRLRSLETYVVRRSQSMAATRRLLNKLAEERKTMKFRL